MITICLFGNGEESCVRCCGKGQEIRVICIVSICNLYRYPAQYCFRIGCCILSTVELLIHHIIESVLNRKLWTILTKISFIWNFPDPSVCMVRGNLVHCYRHPKPEKSIFRIWRWYPYSCSIYYFRKSDWYFCWLWFLWKLPKFGGTFMSYWFSQIDVDDRHRHQKCRWQFLKFLSPTAKNFTNNNSVTWNMF